MEDGFIIGESQIIKDILNTAKQVAPTDATVLIQGDSGTGKELLAKFIQANSNRKDKKFISINCAAIPSPLLENELFGHKKGSYTDAKEDYIGKFGFANGGTVFLDEIGEMDLALQAKILRVVQFKEYEQIGNPQPLRTDVRLISATNKNLLELVKLKKFREDLYYRLNVIPLFLPPLKERGTDIEIIANYFLETYSTKYKKQIKGFSKEAINFFYVYEWKGNVRELENVIERAVVITKDEYITKKDILTEENKLQKQTRNLDIKSLKDAINDFKRDYLIESLNQCNWNQTQTARKLQIERTYLAKLIKDLKIEKI